VDEILTFRSRRRLGGERVAEMIRAGRRE
jgi:hypothetical protein